MKIGTIRDTSQPTSLRSDGLHRTHALDNVCRLNAAQVQVHEPLLRRRKGCHVWCDTLPQHRKRSHQRLERSQAHRWTCIIQRRVDARHEVENARLQRGVTLAVEDRCACHDAQSPQHVLLGDRGASGGGGTRWEDPNIVLRTREMHVRQAVQSSFTDREWMRRG